MAVCLHSEMRSAVSGARVLVVGAGGIGCELIKNLVLTGFKDLVIVDMDTIDVSNLNRQFLFQKCHVGRPKVEVARESALMFNPDATITAIHDSILNSEYNSTFFRQFSLVMNALDNKTARNHVNRLCLAAGVTLIESGTAGYLGQVTVIRKGVSECYECQPKPSPKTFPGCTIRNTPSEPIHCIVWAKHLFSQLFGEPDADNDVSPDTELVPPNGVEEDGMDKEEREEEEREREGEEESKRMSTREWAEGIEYDPHKIFHKLFYADIQYLLTMDKLWRTRLPPTPLSINQLPCDAAGDSTLLPDQRLWSVDKCADIFMQCIHQLREIHCSQGELVWDKDNADHLDFVVAAANIRAFSFGITRKSRFDIKSMAGNIVPAIATTNAIIAGLIVMEALKVLAGEPHKCKTTYLPKQPNPRKRLLVTCSLPPPNPKCYVCSYRPEAFVKLNCAAITLHTVREKILIGHFGMVAPDVEVDDGRGTILLSSEEGETDDNLPHSLSEFGVGDGSRLKVDDFLQNYQLVINIVHIDHLSEEEEFQVVVEEELGEEVELGGRGGGGGGRKRRAADEPSLDGAAAKKQKIHDTDDS